MIRISPERQSQAGPKGRNLELGPRKSDRRSFDVTLLLHCHNPPLPPPWPSQSSFLSSSIPWSSRLHVGQVIQQDYRETTGIPLPLFFVTIPIFSLFPSPNPPPLIVLTSPDQTCPSLYRRHLLSGPSHRNFPMHFLPTIKIFSQTEIVPKLSQMVCVVSKILLIRICHALT